MIKTSPKQLAPGETRPFTVRDCRRNIVVVTVASLFCLSPVFLPPPISGTNDVLYIGAALYLLAFDFRLFAMLRRMRRGERFETVYVAPDPEKARAQARRTRTGAVAIGAVWTAVSLPLTLLICSSFPLAAWLVFLATVGILYPFCVWQYRSAERLSKQGRTEFRKVQTDASRQAQVSANIAALSENRTEASAPAAGHWWTDAQAREEAKVTLRR